MGCALWIDDRCEGWGGLEPAVETAGFKMVDVFVGNA